MKTMRTGRWLTLAAVVCVVILGFASKSYGVQTLNQAVLDHPETLENQTKIVETVLRDTNRRGQYDAADVGKVSVHYGDVTGDGRQDAVVQVQFGPKDTLVAVYQKEENGDGYSFLGEAGVFFDVQRLEFLPIPDMGKSAILLREYANQNIGAFEKNVFVRGYLWDGEAFELVISIPQNIVSTWNRLWNQNAQADPSDWERVVQEGELTLEEADAPSVNASYDQMYQTSTDTQTKNIPADETFSTNKARKIEETYYWDTGWGRFILGEARDPATGETVAILADLSNSPYVLSDDFVQDEGQVRIRRKDGAIEVVNRDSLEMLPQ